MRAALVQAVRQQFGFRCGYCDVSETESGTTFTVDHFYPRSKGGTDNFANLVYCCHACNEHKGDYWNPGGTERVLHPHDDDLAAHYTETESALLEPLSDTGRFHIARFQLNRFALVCNRRVRRERQEDRLSRAAVIDRLERVEETLKQLRAAVERVQSGGE